MTSKRQKIFDHMAMRATREAAKAKKTLDDIEKKLADLEKKQKDDAEQARQQKKYEDFMKPKSYPIAQGGSSVAGGNGVAGGGGNTILPPGTFTYSAGRGGMGGSWGPPPSGYASKYTYKAASPPTPAKPAKPKVPYSGMAGFSESGAPEDWDMAVGEVYGYRWWKLTVPASVCGFQDSQATHGTLTSKGLVGANDQLWQPGKNEAVCTANRYITKTWDALIDGTEVPDKHLPPETRWACGCGFWAYFDKNLDVAYHFNSLRGDIPCRSYQGPAELAVFGVVKGTGRVIIGEKGFRSQYAEILGLALPPVVHKQLGYWLVAADYSYHRDDDEFIIGGGGGGGGVYRAFGRDDYWRVEHHASDSERKARLATVEAFLVDGYPAAKIFSDVESLVKYFPPDVNYS